MSKLFFLQKRNIEKNNEYIVFSSYRLSYKFTKILYDEIKNSKIYKDLENKYDKKLIEIYFKKLLFYEFLPITNQITINDYNNLNNLITRKLDVSSLRSLFTIKILNKKNLLKYEINYINYYLFKNIKKLAKLILNYKNKTLNFLLYLKIKKYLIKNLSKYKNEKNSYIAVNYAEGLISEKKSDLFWFNSKFFSKKNIIIYLKDLSLLNKHQNYLKNLNYINANSFRLLILKPIKFYATDLNYKKKLSAVDSFIYNISITIDSEVEYWFNFFKKNNIKIHLDPTEYGLETITKQIALNQFNGCSIGKLRSYPSDLKGKFLGYYPNDVFFTWGKHSANKLLNSENHISNIILSGFPYIINKKISNEVKKIKKDFKNHGVKFTILLLDTNHSDNKNHYFQYIPTKIIIEFYNRFLNLLKKDNEIGIIIKSKKNIIINKDKQLKKIILEAERSNRLLNVKDPFQTLPVYYSEVSDLTIGIGTFISSALMECVYNNDRCIYYDYGINYNNLTDIYEDGINKFIFNDLDNMMNHIVEFKKKNATYSFLGDWSNYFNSIRSFNDNDGSLRISEYLRDLKFHLDTSMNKKQSITKANENYIKKYGDDKLLIK